MDGFPSTYPYIKDGRIAATMSQQPHRMGAAAGETLKQIFEGGTPETVQYQDFQRVEQTNVDEMQQKLLYGPRFKDEYGK
jgi:ABC-type sugar transport system substrate-binding protein